MKYGAVAVVGLLVLLVGFSMPATETINSQSCTEGFTVGNDRFGGGCVEAQTEVPNTSRGPILLVGFILTVGGGTMAVLNAGLKKGTSKVAEKGWVDIPAENADSQTSNTPVNDIGDDTTRIRITAEAKNTETGRTAEYELTVETTDISEAKNRFLEQCNQEDMEVVSELQTEIIE